jgi:hypothetical protein
MNTRTMDNAFSIVKKKRVLFVDDIENYDKRLYAVFYALAVKHGVPIVSSVNTLGVNSIAVFKKKSEVTYMRDISGEDMFKFLMRNILSENIDYDDKVGEVKSFFLEQECPKVVPSLKALFYILHKEDTSVARDSSTKFYAKFLDAHKVDPIYDVLYEAFNKELSDEYIDMHLSKFGKTLTNNLHYNALKNNRVVETKRNLDQYKKLLDTYIAASQIEYGLYNNKFIWSGYEGSNYMIIKKFNSFEWGKLNPKVKNPPIKLNHEY